MSEINLKGLVQGGRIGPQVLGHQQARFVIDRSDVERVFDEASGLWVCPLDRIFISPLSTFIVFGTPNVALVVPNREVTGWDRLAAFMFWRTRSFVADTKGRVQAGIFYELVGLPPNAIEALRHAMQSLIGTRKASCAHSVALALHRAGFTSNGSSLRWVYRPSRLSSILWRNGLEYKGKPIEVRIIQTNKAVSDHFVSVWKREYNSAVRLIRKLFTKGHHAPAPVFTPAEESVEMSDAAWTGNRAKIDLGVGLASSIGVNLSYVFGEQPVFVARLPEPLDDERLATPLQSFPGTLDRVTKLKKHVLFSKPVIWFLRKHLVARTQWLRGIRACAAVGMLRQSPGPHRQQAFVYNFVLTGTELRLKRLENRNGRDQKFVNWMLAKHVLLAGYSKDVRLAGEVWCYKGPDGDLVVRMSGDSGTYKPNVERAEAAAALLGKLFDAKVEIVPRQER